MAPGSVPTNARAPGSHPIHPVPLAQNMPIPGPSNSSPSVHTLAQLVPVTVPGPNSDSSHADIALPDPDDESPQPIPGQPYKDGRIRNPVPSKLKGKTSNASGRFAVMHMDIRVGKDVAADRDAAAKRTSENTALAAKMAFENGYQPHRKSNWLRVPEDSPPDPNVPFTGTTPYNHALYGLPKPTSNLSKEGSMSQPSRPLSSEECKEEQARLLTLLRSLQPVAVVDQICKALAYFGGVPEAPPPQDDKFPESAEANGQGSVFVGWIAEIFPDLDAEGRRKTRPPRAAPDPPPVQTTEKRGRGRPKGSKASKFRSDKGIKKGPKRSLLGDGVEMNGADNDDSWVDVDDTGIDDDHDVVHTGATEAPARPTPEPPLADVQGQESARKRGRPKGSKNRPKDPTATAEGEFGSNPQPLSALFSIGKKGSGRPKGSKNRPKDTTGMNGALHTANGSLPPHATPPSAQAVPGAEPLQHGESEFQLAALKAFNESQPIGSGTQASSFQPVNTASEHGKSQPKKRKRNAKDGEVMNQMATGSVPPALGTTSAMVQPSVNNIPGPSVIDATAPASTVPPVTKRPRKSKVKGKIAANGALLADQTATGGASHVVGMYTNSTIEDLEAQFEQQDDSSLQSPHVTSVPAARQTQQAHPEPPQQHLGQPQAPNSHPVPQGQPKTDQRAMARQMQQVVTRTASPSVSHMSGQSVSPNMNTAHTASPNLHQHRTSNSQTPTSIQSQQPRNPPSYYTQQNTSAQSPYGQQSQQYATAQPSPQPSKQQFAVQPSQQQHGYSATQQPSQQPSYTSQQQQQQPPPPQYPQKKQQPYSAQSQQQYASPQQQYSSQQRIQQQQQQYATTSSATTPQTLSAQSPQYGTSTAPGYNSTDGSFRTNSTTGMNFGSSTYGSNQTSNAPRTNNLYSTSTTNSYGPPSQQISSYATGNRRTLPTTTSHHNSVQNVQSLPQNLGGFSDFGNLGFDSNLMSGLDNSTTGHTNLGMNTTSYNMGTGNVSRSSGGTNNFSSLNTFDSTLRNDGSYNFGLRR